MAGQCKFPLELSLEHWMFTAPVCCCTSSLRIFKLCLESSGNVTATFEKLTEIEVPGDLDFWTLEGDRIFVAHNDLIYMWDWKLGSIGVIRMGHTRGMEFPVGRVSTSVLVVSLT